MKKGIPILFFDSLLNIGYIQVIWHEWFLSYLSPVKGHLQIVPHFYTVYELIWHNILNAIDKVHTTSVFIIKDSELRSSPEKKNW